ncbi:MAG: ASKHA domain-containing protein [Desulfobacteraceae bacterium]|nr:ASKHA domain-containing protein [Desulfobacteraceae bacterium]
MGKCVNHPDRETSYKCMKHNIYLCEECIECRDPELYCTHRSACPIWFANKGTTKLDAGEKAPDRKTFCTVRFSPGGQVVDVPEGATLLDAAKKADVYINASCNGKGVCGKCKLIIVSGEIEKIETALLSDRERQKGYVLACQSRVRVRGPVSVKVPEETIERKLKVAGVGRQVTERLQGLVSDICPMLNKVALELSPPTLDDPISDLDRLKRGLKRKGIDTRRLNIGLPVMRQLASAMRNENWRATASVLHKACSSEVVAVEPGNTHAASLGLAIDIGTTTIVVYLVDMTDGRVLAATSGHNRQAAFGDDVINRIVCAEKDGVKKLSALALSTINTLIKEAIDGAGMDFRRISNIAIAGNTTMIHLLLQIEPRYIRREPYIPSISEFPVLQNSSIGLKANPNAGVFVMPGPASYVGGDIVSGVLYSGLYREQELTLFIDVGTNGEIVLGNRDWLICASCSAGPAFEGGGIRWGMRAEEGAIEGVKIDRDTLEASVQTVGGKEPRGICGTGMIELISEMMFSGLIDQRGKFQISLDHPCMSMISDEPVYILVFANQTPMDEDIVFTESDIDNLIRSKGAVYAGFTVLLNQVGVDFDMIDRVIITGGFGQYLDIEKSISIGLLPDIDRGKFHYYGNSSIAGAYMALLSDGCRREAKQICNSMTYLDFSSNPAFMNEFTSALFLPHTNLHQFPSASEKLVTNRKSRMQLQGAGQ